MRESNASRFEMRIGDFHIVSRKYDPSQARGPKGSPEGGRWVKGSTPGQEYWVGEGKLEEQVTGRKFTSDEGYEWHEQGPVAEWAKNLPYKDAKALDNYAGFGYGEVNRLRRGEPPTKEQKVRTITQEEYDAIQATATGEEVQRLIPPEGKEYRYSWAYEHAKDTPSGPEKLRNHWAVVGPKIDEARLAIVTEEANKIDDLIANRGYELPEAITVERGAYLPGVSYEDLEAMVGGVHEEKGFTSTMVGEAGRRAYSYPALGKWESLHKRYGKIAGHEDEVGSAVRFHIVLPKGTKVASVEAVRRLGHEFPKKPITDRPVPENLDPKYWVESDYTQTPTTTSGDLDKGKEGNRTESEALLGSGARFRVIHVKKGYTYPGGGGTAPVDVFEVYLQYIGGGTSEGKQ